MKSVFTYFDTFLDYCFYHFNWCWLVYFINSEIIYPDVEENSFLHPPSLVVVVHVVVVVVVVVVVYVGIAVAVYVGIVVVVVVWLW